MTDTFVSIAIIALGIWAMYRLITEIARAMDASKKAKHKRKLESVTAANRASLMAVVDIQHAVNLVVHVTNEITSDASHDCGQCQTDIAAIIAGVKGNRSINRIPPDQLNRVFEATIRWSHEKLMETSHV